MNKSSLQHYERQPRHSSNHGTGPQSLPYQAKRGYLAAMHFHYFALQKLASWLREEALGAILVEVFSQEKDQAVVGLALPDRDIFLRVSCSGPLPYIWPQNQGHKAKRNVFVFFQQAWGSVLTSVEVVPWERVLVLTFGSGYQVIMKMHGLASNLILMKEEQVVSVFRHNLKEDSNFSLAPGKFDSLWKSSSEHGEGLSTLDRLKMISPVFERRFALQTEHSMESGMSFDEAFERVMKEATDDRYYVVKEKSRLLFELFEPQHLPYATVKGIVPALDTFLRSWHVYEQYAKQFSELTRGISKQAQQARNMLESCEISIRQIQNERAPEEFGHLLMANLHLLSTGMERVKLRDFYHDQDLEIKMRKELNPLENAEYFYQKSKKHKAKLKYLQGQLEGLKSENEHWKALESEASQLIAPQDLNLTEKGIDTGPFKHLTEFHKKFQSRLTSQGTRPEDRKHPFVEVYYMGYVILMGKNARQNDELTFKFAKKTDIWLHARDAQGSHVLVRNPQDKDLPKPVLEYAAALAAGNSKRKHESLVPVQYTSKRYIRKVKNGAPGQVIVEREKVLMIEPFTNS